MASEKTLAITVTTEITVEDKYCGEYCNHLHEWGRNYNCRLFNVGLVKCLGGGPLRCLGCCNTVTAQHPHG